MPRRPQPLTTALLVAAALLFCTRLGVLDLWAPDEPRYAQVAEEMRSMEHGLGGLLLLHLNGEAYTQKPPLYYWLAAAGGWITGGRVTETLARLPSALAGVAVVLVCIRFGGRLFPGTLAGPLAAALLLSTYYFAFLARRAQLDVVLTLFETAALLCFWRIETTGCRPRRAAVALLHGLLGVAALTKGPVGWIPLLVIAAYLALDRRLGAFRALCPAWALLLSIGPTLGWAAAATALAPAGYFQEAVVDNVFGRVYAAASHVRPFYYFLYQLPLSFLPGTLLAPLVLREGRRAFAAGGERRSAWRLLLLWVVVPLVLFSLASGKRGLYMLPSFPALALLCGASLDAWLARDVRLPRPVTALLFACGLGLAAAFLGFGALGDGLADVLGRGLPAGFDICIPEVRQLFAVAAAGLLIAAGAAARTKSARPPLLVLTATILALELLLFTRIFPHFDETKSPRPIALEAARLTATDEAIGIFDDQGLAGGILYYGNRRVEILARAPNVADFFAAGGRLVVLERWKLPWIAEVGSFEVLTSVREGQRELAIVRKVGPGAR